MSEKSPCIVLSMIVRDEGDNILACLETVAPWITHWAIVDTGSSDDTIAKVLARLAHLPGQIVSRTWTNDFAHARNQAVELARQVVGRSPDAFLMLIDADERIDVQGGLVGLKRRLAVNDLLYWYVHDEGFRFRKAALVKLSVVLWWQGTRHEQLRLTSPVRSSVLNDVLVYYGHTGFRRRDENAAAQDIQHLRRADDVPSARFHLARTLESAQRYSEAIESYTECFRADRRDSDMAFQSKWGVARCMHAGEIRSFTHQIEAFDEAHRVAPKRAEPILALGEISLSMNDHISARKLAAEAKRCSLPIWTLMYDYAAYTWAPHWLMARALRQTSGQSALNRAFSHTTRALSHYWLPSVTNRRIMNEHRRIEKAIKCGSIGAT
jgi:glycosyltransferase involved in cell wall biosynthesis